MSDNISDDIQNKILYILLAVIGVVYFFTFPQGWLISDEYTYVNAAMSILDKEPYPTYLDPITNYTLSIKNSTYTLGNSFWIAAWAKIIGIRSAYLASLFLTIGGLFLIHKSLRKENGYLPAISLAILYPATLIYSHSYMSGVPSFGLVCLFAYFLFHKEESGRKWFWLTFIAALSFWFRETNVLLLGGICLIHFIQDRRWFLYYAIGGILGFLPRILSAWWAYDDPFYYVLGAGFSIDNLINNIPLYTILSMILLPFGWIMLIVYKGRYRYPIVISMLAFLLLYLFYGYNAWGYSGHYTGTVVMSRFLLPLLPFYVIISGVVLKKIKIPKTISYLFYGSAFIVAIVFQITVHKEATIHAEVSNQIYKDYSEEFVMFDLSGLTNVIRYTNEFHGTFRAQSDIANLKDEDYMNRLFEKEKQIVVLQTINSVNEQKMGKTEQISDYVNYALEQYLVINQDTINIKPGLMLTLVTLSSKK